jgi:L-ascorbate metabolism protein UlaG (beta-lactamase superfamily)
VFVYHEAVEIKYIGHSCFRLKGKKTTLVMDPFDSKMVGLTMPKVKADIVTVSHDHKDHNAVERVQPADRDRVFLIDRPGEYEVGGIGVIGVKTWHDDKKGSERGDNLVYVAQMDGVIVAHLGDLGHVLSDKQVSNIGAVDVLLLPVGGKFTIGPSEAVKVVDQLSPSIVIPMHYKQKGMGESFAELLTLEEVTSKMGWGEVVREDKLVVKKESLPDEMQVVVLKS